MEEAVKSSRVTSKKKMSEKCLSSNKISRKATPYVCQTGSFVQKKQNLDKAKHIRFESAIKAPPFLVGLFSLSPVLSL